MTTIRLEFAKYFVAGTLAFLSDFAIYMTLTGGAGINYLLANVVGFCVGLTVSYLFCIRWVFAHRTYGVPKVELPVFLGISLVMLLVGEVILLGLVEYVALGTAMAKIVMTGMIFFGNFALKKLLLFRRRGV
jgi:putative flippase GtrA